MHFMRTKRSAAFASSSLDTSPWLAIVNLTTASSAICTKRTCPTDLTMSDIGVDEKWLAGVQYDAIDPLRTFLTNAKIKLHRQESTNGRSQ
jgi:hypothetical protein